MSIISLNKSEKLLSTAKDLFWRYGFKRVSVEEICRKAGVSKMTFYRQYENKTELAKKILDSIFEEGTMKFCEILNSDCPASEKMRQMVLLKMEGTKDISREFLEEVYNDQGSELQSFTIRRSAEIWEGLLAEFKDAQKRGVFRKDFKPEFLLAMSQKMADLINDPQISKMYDSPQDMIIEITNLITYGIAPR